MIYLNIERQKGVNYILVDKSGVKIGYGRKCEYEREKRKMKSTGTFAAGYFWSNDGFFTTGHYYKDDE